MLLIQCPRCAKKMAVDRSKAGGVGGCPDCGQRFRVPVPRAKRAMATVSTQSASTLGRNSSSPGNGRSKTSASAVQNPYIDDDCPFTVVSDKTTDLLSHRNTTAPARKLRDEAESLPYVEPIEEEEQPAKRNLEHQSIGDKAAHCHAGRPMAPRKKKRGASDRLDRFIPGIPNIVTGLAALGILWLLLSIASLIVHPVAYALILIGFGTAACARWALIQAATEEGEGMLLRWVPFYEIYFLVSHPDLAAKPMLVNYCGRFMLGTGVFLGFLTGLFTT